MDDFKDYKEVSKQVKIICGNTQEEAYKKLKVFEKTHSILEIKQHDPKIIFVFYVE